MEKNRKTPPKVMSHKRLLSYDVMLHGRYVCTLTYDFFPLFAITEEELCRHTESERPSLKGKAYTIHFNKVI